MKIIALADTDNAAGLRLAGVKTICINNNEELKNHYKKLIEDKEIGLILITEGLAQNIKNEIDEFKMFKNTPLILEIPERTGSKKNKNYLTNFINESVGLKI